MRKSQELTKSQKQLLYLLPVLNDRQVAGMLSTLKKPARRAEKNDAYRQLMNMTGCAEAKEQLTALLAAHRMSQIAESRSRTVQQPYFHAVFTGNPGCAKTTCARLYARALAQEGITKHDRFAELTRASLCGKYQGHTAQMVKEVFKQNKGGTIFIDEAYSLASDERDSFGAEAIDEIIVGLENDRGLSGEDGAVPRRKPRPALAHPVPRALLRLHGGRAAGDLREDCRGQRLHHHRGCGRKAAGHL